MRSYRAQLLRLFHGEPTANQDLPRWRRLVGIRVVVGFKLLVPS